MTYPPDDEETHDERLRRERAERLTAARREHAATGICTFRVLSSDYVSVACEICEHAITLHPGYTNPDPDLTGCVVCHLKLLAQPRRPPALDRVTLES